MKKQRFLTILLIMTILIVAYKQAPLSDQNKETKSIDTIIPVTAFLPSPYNISMNTETFIDSLSAWEAFKKTALNKLDANAKVIIQLKVSIPQGSDNSKKEYLKKISDFERRNDNLRNNLQVIKELANESLVIFKNNFNYENTALVNEMQLVIKK
jgi:hypothetical protein